MSKTCPQCGEPVSAGQPVCMNCGLSMEPVRLNYPRPSYRCSHCGTYNFQEAKLCATCGHRLRPSAWRTVVAILMAMFLIVPLGLFGCCVLMLNGVGAPGAAWTTLAVLTGVGLLIWGAVVVMNKLLKP